MTLANILLEGVEVMGWSEELEELDPWVALDQLEHVFKMRNIRPDRDKEAHLIVVDDGRVVGGSFNKTTNVEGGLEYSFDIALLPEYERRGIGTSLITREINHARQMECDSIYAWAVNPWVARTLEDKFGFDASQKWPDGSATLHLIL